MHDTAQIDLKQILVDRHDSLPPQLRRISQFVLDHPQQVALMTIADISGELGVQPSSVIRFSKAVGFQGFSEIQRILKSELSGQIPANYYARLPEPQTDGPSDLARFTRLAHSSLANLPDEALLDQAATLLTKARIIHILGLRRAYGIAVSLNYLLSGFGAPVNVLEPIGNMHEAMMSSVTSDDVLVAFSFPSYTATTLETLAVARERGARIIAVTDSAVSPIAQGAEVVLITDQTTDGGFRSTAGSMVISQALALGYGQKTAV